MTAGYSGTPLTNKLGIKPGFVVGTIGAEPSFREWLDPLPDGVHLVVNPDVVCDVLVVFAVAERELTERFAAARDLLRAAGALWVGWPKRASGIATELSFDVVQSHGLQRGLVDNKVCAINVTWSGLRFVVRVDEREAWPR